MQIFKKIIIFIVCAFLINCTNHESVKITNENAYESFVSISQIIKNNLLAKRFKEIYEWTIYTQTKGVEGKRSLIQKFGKPYDKITLGDLYKSAKKKSHNHKKRITNKYFENKYTVPMRLTANLKKN
jgi:hypothetical protein